MTSSQDFFAFYVLADNDSQKFNHEEVDDHDEEEFLDGDGCDFYWGGEEEHEIMFRS